MVGAIVQSEHNNERNNMIIYDMSNEEYHAHQSVSKSGLDLINRSPAHYYHAVRTEATRAMDIGTAIHCAILEPSRFETQYLLLRDVTDRRKSEYKEAVKQYGSEFVLTGPEADRVVGMRESIRMNNRATMRLDAPGNAEVSIITKDPETGVAVRCRFDWLSLCGNAVDLKKTQDVRTDEFSRTVARYRYHVQAAFYSDVYEWETGERLQEFSFLAVEEHMPHANRIFILDDEAIREGRKLYRENLNTYARCLDSGQWPGITQDEDELLSLPMWAVSDEEITFDE